MFRFLNQGDWAARYDDSEIDELIWAEIKASPSKGDFVCYLIHRLSNAKYRDEAQQRAAAISDAEDPAPIAYRRAIKRIRTLAESGNVTAMFHMGKIYAFGIATDQDLGAAIRWYEKAAEQNDVRACCNLGWLYQAGDGVAADKKKAYRLLSVGVANDMMVAVASVGMMRVVGEGCTQDVESGLQMMEQAFDAGYLNAGNHLSDLYLAGEHVPQDIELGHEWLMRVAQCGDARSMAILAHRFVTGSHGKHDYDQGMKLFSAALANGFTTAYLWLGGLYRDGQGVDTIWKKRRSGMHREPLRATRNARSHWPVLRRPMRRLRLRSNRFAYSEPLMSWRRRYSVRSLIPSALARSLRLPRKSVSHCRSTASLISASPAAGVAVGFSGWSR